VLWIYYKFGWLISWLLNKTYAKKWKKIVYKLTVSVSERNSFLFWCRNILLHRNPSHTICNGHMIHCLRLGNIRNTQYLLILNTKQNNFVTNICWRFCVSGNIKKLWSVTALCIFEVWAARCYWQLLFHLVKVGMKNFQLLLCLTS